LSPPAPNAGPMSMCSRTTIPTPDALILPPMYEFTPSGECIRRGSTYQLESLRLRLPLRP
jgi:hypothetical protein